MLVNNIQMVGLYVADFMSAVNFYRDVLEIPLEIDAHGDYHHADYSFRDPYFHFAIFPAGDEHPEVSPVHLSLNVTDCRGVLHRALAAGATISREPVEVTYSGGGLSAEVLDPDGNEVELFQASDSNSQG